jgi:hypothetical protein
VEDDEEEYELTLRNMLVNMARMIQIARSKAGRTPADRREYITNALLCKVSDTSVTAEVVSAW